jgi:hypothetical protein
MKEKKHCWRVCRSTLTALVLLSLVGGGTASAETETHEYDSIGKFGQWGTSEAVDNGNIVITNGINGWGDADTLVVGNTTGTENVTIGSGISNGNASEIDVHGLNIANNVGIYSNKGTISVGDLNHTESVTITSGINSQSNSESIVLHGKCITLNQGIINQAGKISIGDTGSESVEIRSGINSQDNSQSIDLKGKKITVKGTLVAQNYTQNPAAISIGDMASESVAITGGIYNNASNGAISINLRGENIKVGESYSAGIRSSKDTIILGGDETESIALTGDVVIDKTEENIDSALKLNSKGTISFDSPMIQALDNTEITGHAGTGLSLKGSSIDAPGKLDLQTDGGTITVEYNSIGVWSGGTVLIDGNADSEIKVGSVGVGGSKGSVTLATKATSGHINVNNAVVYDDSELNIGSKDVDEITIEHMNIANY